MTITQPEWPQEGEGEIVQREPALGWKSLSLQQAAVQVQRSAFRGGACNSGLAAESPLITHVGRGNGGPTAAFPHCHLPRRGSGGFRWILRRRSECAVALKCHSEPPIAREKWPASFATVDRAKFSSPSTDHRQLE